MTLRDPSMNVVLATGSVLPADAMATYKGKTVRPLLIATLTSTVILRTTPASTLCNLMVNA